MDDRWSLPDLTSTIPRCRNRAGQGIRCIVALLTEYARTPAESALAMHLQLEGIRAVGGLPGASFSIKPSSIGILSDPAVFRANLATIAREAKEREVLLEIDMEGRPLVEETLRSALSLASGDAPVTVALQAYLDRTPRDLEVCLQAGIRVRLVKGAYLGDTGDFAGVQQRFRALAADLISADVPFSAGTHDPEVIAWLRDETASRRDLVEFSFLKGLSEQTMTALAAEGRKVAEYVPCGPDGDSYRMRRQRYLDMLEKLGRAPAP